MKYIFEPSDIVANFKVKVAGIGLITVIEVHRSLTPKEFGDKRKYSAVREDVGLMMFPVTTSEDLASWFTGNQAVPQLNWKFVELDDQPLRVKGVIE